MPSRARPQAPNQRTFVRTRLRTCQRRTSHCLLAYVGLRCQSESAASLAVPMSRPLPVPRSARPPVHHSSCALKIKPFIGLMSRALASETSWSVLETAWPDRVASQLLTACHSVLARLRTNCRRPPNSPSRSRSASVLIPTSPSRTFRRPFVVVVVVVVAKRTSTWYSSVVAHHDVEPRPGLPGAARSGRPGPCFSPDSDETMAQRSAAVSGTVGVCSSARLVHR